MIDFISPSLARGITVWPGGALEQCHELGATRVEVTSSVPPATANLARRNRDGDMG